MLKCTKCGDSYMGETAHVCRTMATLIVMVVHSPDVRKVTVQDQSGAELACDMSIVYASLPTETLTEGTIETFKEQYLLPVAHARLFKTCPTSKNGEHRNIWEDAVVAYIGRAAGSTPLLIRGISLAYDAVACADAVVEARERRFPAVPAEQQQQVHYVNPQIASKQ